MNDMYENKRVLLIGGGGTLGEYTAAELLRLGCSVDIICLEDKVSDNEKLSFFKKDATDITVLKELVENNKYNGIVNFIHYAKADDYKKVHPILIKNCDHLIFLSSYRVYADLQHPITEEAPKLLDVSSDETFIRTENYAISKALCERYLFRETTEENFTVVRPVISFSKYRFDLVTYFGYMLQEKLASGETVPLPITAKNLTAGLDWAGNSGKLIANLLFKPHTFRQAYTVSSGQNLTWEECAKLYNELMGLKYEWVSDEEYMKQTDYYNYFALLYDRFFDRKIDNSKILQATGLTKSDFTPVKEGLIMEFEKYRKDNAK